jgi:hypothetical protein
MGSEQSYPRYAVSSCGKKNKICTFKGGCPKGNYGGGFGHSGLFVGHQRKYGEDE